GGNAKIGIGLARSGADHAQQLLFLESVNSFNGQRSDSRLLAFLNCKRDEQVSFFTPVIVLHVRRDLRIEKAVGLIKGLHRLPIGLHEAAAETPRRAERPLEDLQPALQQFRVKVLVSGNLNAYKLVLIASFDSVSNRFLSALPNSGIYIVHFDFVA